MQKAVEEEGTMSQCWNRHGSCFFLREKDKGQFLYDHISRIIMYQNV